MPVPASLLRRSAERFFGPRGRSGGRSTVSPRAATMTSRRVADSAGRSSLSTATRRQRGRSVRASARPAMATSEATIRFNASIFLSIASCQSTCVFLSSEQQAESVRQVAREWKELGDFFRMRRAGTPRHDPTEAPGVRPVLRDARRVFSRVLR